MTTNNQNRVEFFHLSEGFGVRLYGESVNHFRRWFPGIEGSLSASEFADVLRTEGIAFGATVPDSLVQAFQQKGCSVTLPCPS